MKNYRDDPFFQYPLNKYPTSEGDVDMPILYFDNSNFMAIFYVDHDKAQALTGQDGFDAVRFGNGKALTVVAFYEYRHTAIGSYNEVGVAIAAVPPGTPLPSSPLRSLLRHPDKNPVGLNIIDLPVTTAAACAAGREIWGYPKFVTPITFSLKGRDFRGAVRDPGAERDICTLSGRTGMGVAGPLLDLVLYSRLNGQVLRGSANTRGGGRLCLPGSVRLKVSESTHRMAENLRALGLDGAKPAFIGHSHKLQLRLNAGAIL
jgi:hypothetical protein